MLQVGGMKAGGGSHQGRRVWQRRLIKSSRRRVAVWVLAVLLPFLLSLVVPFSVLLCRQLLPYFCPPL